jgi:hypothetical protein
MGRTKDLANFVSGIEEAAYQRGYNDAVRDAARALKRLRQEAQANRAKERANGHDSDNEEAREEIVVQRYRRMRANSDQMRVLKAIRATPGMRGVEIVRALEATGSPIHERTVRTALSRLNDRYIEQRDDKWYEIETGQSP